MIIVSATAWWAMPTLQIQAVDYLAFVGWALPTIPYRWAARGPNDDRGRHGSSRLISRAILFSDKVLTKIQWSISNVQENQLSLAMFLPVHFLVDKVLVPVLSALLSVGYSSVALIHQQFL